MKRKPISLEDIKRSACAPLNPHLFEKAESKPKKSKYGNKKTEVDGILFASIKEAERYKELKLMQKAGLIGLLELQVPFELNPGGTHSLRYIADFTYVDSRTGERVVEDCKGAKTAVYLKKKRLMWKVHKIQIKET